jgi:ankyrin repeat protein
MPKPIAQAAAALLAAAACFAAGDAHVAGDARLIDAVKRRDPAMVARLIEQGAAVNGQLADGSTALAWAVYGDDKRVARMLLKAGAAVTVNAATDYGETALTLACLNGDGEMVEELLSAGANARASRRTGETALMIAAGSGSLRAVDSLIRHGADINAAESSQGQTALMWAAAEKHTEIVDLLVAKGANIHLATKSGFTALAFATIANDGHAVKSLLAAGGDPKLKLGDGTELLLAATSHRSTDAAIALLDAGADPGVKDRQGNTPMQMASQRGNLPLVQSLLAHGASVLPVNMVREADGRSASGQTALFLAARGGHLEVMKALPDGSSFLMAAVGSANVEAVRLAYEYDSDVNTVREDGSTLMHASVTGTGNSPEAQARIVEVIQFLADHGARLDELNKANRTAIDIADVGPTDRAVLLITKLILAKGGYPVHPSKRGIGLPPRTQ